MQEVSTSAACFFAAARFFAAAAGEPLLVLVSLSLSGVSLRLFGRSSKTQVAYLLICLPSLLCLNVQGWDKQTTLGIFGATVFYPPHLKSISKLHNKAKKAGSNSILHPVDNYSS